MVRKQRIVLFILICLCIVSLNILYFTKRTYQQNRFDLIIEKYANQYGISFFLIKAIIKKESNFNYKSLGKKKEYGLMQITQGVVDDWNRKFPHKKIEKIKELFSPELNIKIGVWYLSLAFKRWKGYKDILVLSLAQYNAGPKAMKKWVPKNKNAKILENISYPTTKQYIKDILHYQKLYQ